MHQEKRGSAAGLKKNNRIKRAAAVSVLIVTVTAACTLLSGCSAVSGLLGELGISGLEDKIDTAWNGIGKDALSDLTDDMWRDYGFGRSLNWPDKGSGKYVPKLRDGTNDYTYVSEDGSSGVIKISGVSSSDVSTYIEALDEVGYEACENPGGFDSVYLCDGLYIGLQTEGKTLFICYGASAEDISGIRDIAES